MPSGRRTALRREQGSPSAFFCRKNFEHVIYSSYEIKPALPVYGQGHARRRTDADRRSDSRRRHVLQENYSTTHMFDSAKIGLEYLRDKCDRILFTPVDIPLFTSATVKSLMDSSAPLACPIFNGEPGHPIMLSAALVDRLLADSGEDGLKGALLRCGAAMEQVPVSDPGILHDADTPEDYKTLLKIHNSQLVRPLVSVSLAREKPFFDSRIAMLLSLVDETGSVRSACQRMQLSYSSGWNMIKTLESQLNRPLIIRSKGGAKGGQSSLTDDGRDFLSRYNSYVNEVRELANELYAKHFGGVFP